MEIRLSVNDGELTDEQKRFVEVLVLEKGVENVRTAQFRGLPRLKKVIVSSTVCDWGAGGSFRDCPNLEEVVLYCDKVPPRAFAQCRNLKTVQMDSVLSVGDYAFSGCGLLDESSLRLQAKQNLFARLYDIEMTGNAWAKDWAHGYKAIAEEFEAADWNTCERELLDRLVIRDNSIAKLGLASVAISGVRNIQERQLREICAEIKNVSEDWHDAPNRLAQIQERFVSLATMEGAVSPLMIFSRMVAGIAPRRVVPIPNDQAVDAIYGWLTRNRLTDLRAGTETGHALWVRQAEIIRQTMSSLLPDKSIYEAGVFAWSLYASREADRVQAQGRQRAAMRLAERAECRDNDGMFLGSDGEAVA